MSWTLFPIYGLKITEPDAWVDDPVFKDATLVSMAAFENHLKERLGDQYHPMLAHGKISEAVDISSLGLPMDQLLETRPTSYIAVRSRSDFNKTKRRATEIRALLSATLMLRGLRLQTVAGDPAHVAWFIAPYSAVVNVTEPPNASTTPFFNEHVLLKPLEVAQADLRRSLKDGSKIPNNMGWDWDIHEEHPVCQLFLSNINKFQKRLLNAALQLQQAGCAISYENQVQMAVAGFEVMLKSESFDELRNMMQAFFPGEAEVKRIGGLITMRHRITHEGAVDDLEKVKVAARDGLILGWTMLDIATAFDSMGLTTTFDDYIRLLIDAHDLDERFGRLGDASGKKYETALRDRIPSFIKHLTIKANFPDAPDN